MFEKMNIKSVMLKIVENNKYVLVSLKHYVLDKNGINNIGFNFVFINMEN